jgi:hypothetical protein
MGRCGPPNLIPVLRCIIFPVAPRRQGPGASDEPWGPRCRAELADDRRPVRLLQCFLMIDGGGALIPVATERSRPDTGAKILDVEPSLRIRPQFSNRGVPEPSTTS